MANGLWRRLRGDLYLAFRAVLIHPLKQVFRRNEGTGLEQFLSHYGPEGLVPTSAADRLVLRGASRCIHCGLCDAFDPTLPASGTGALPLRQVQDGPSLLPVQYARATPDLPHAARALDALTDEALRRAESVCPTRVPLRDIAAYLRRKRSEVEQAQAGIEAGFHRSVRAG